MCGLGGEVMPEYCPKCGSEITSNLIEARAKGYKSGYHCRFTALRNKQLTPCWSLKVHGDYMVCDTRSPMCPIFLHWERVIKAERRRK